MIPTTDKNLKLIASSQELNYTFYLEQLSLVSQNTRKYTGLFLLEGCGGKNEKKNVES